MAKIYFVLLAALISLEAVSSQNNLPTYVRGVSRQVRVSGGVADPKCDATDFGAFCVDCSTKIFCAGAGSPLATVTCAGMDYKKPYCVKGECTDKKDPTAGNTECDAVSGIQCTFDGYLPDPRNCSAYYYCQVSTKVATRYECPSKYAYDHATKSCKQQKSPTDCAVMKCEPGKLFTSYPPDKSIYGVCDQKKNQTTVFQCKDEQNEWFNEATASCGLICRKEGRFNDRRNCKAFYTCYVVDGKWDLRHEDCPPTMQFDKEKLECVPETSPACTNEITA